MINDTREEKGREREREKHNNSKCHKGPSKLQTTLGWKGLPDEVSREEPWK